MRARPARHSPQSRPRSRALRHEDRPIAPNVARGLAVPAGGAPAAPFAPPHHAVLSAVANVCRCRHGPLLVQPRAGPRDSQPSTDYWRRLGPIYCDPCRIRRRPVDFSLSAVRASVGRIAEATRNCANPRARHLPQQWRRMAANYAPRYPPGLSREQPGAPSTVRTAAPAFCVRDFLPCTRIDIVLACQGIVRADHSATLSIRTTVMLSSPPLRFAASTSSVTMRSRFSGFEAMRTIS